MLDELRARFRTRFIDTARDRIHRCTSMLGESGRAAELAVELHSLAGEAAMLGLHEISATARTGEDEARRWDDGVAEAQVACARAVRTLRHQIEAFAAEPPAAAGQAAPDTAAGAGTVPDASPGQGARRILVVDDSALASEELADGLGRAGFEIRTAADQETATREVADFAPALVLTDVHMPGTDPVTLCSALRAAARAPLVIVLMSGRTDGALEAVAGDAGANGFVSKQRGTERIVEHVRDILEEAAP